MWLQISQIFKIYNEIPPNKKKNEKSAFFSFLEGREIKKSYF